MGLFPGDFNHVSCNDLMMTTKIFNNYFEFSYYYFETVFQSITYAIHSRSIDNHGLYI